MASVFQRGRRLYIKVKDEEGNWRNRPSPYNVGQEELAQRYADEVQRIIDSGQATVAEPPRPDTVRSYAEGWTAERRKRVRSSKPDLNTFRRYVFDDLGDVPLSDVTPEHARDLVRRLRSLDLAPKTVINIYSMVHGMFEDAVIEGKVVTNPIRVKPGELPKKVDKDPEWRALATYTTDEVETLIGDPRVPVERRVQYALKSLAGLRHGEMAALRWRHYDDSCRPLGRLTVAVSYDSHASEEKRTKTETTRLVPVHPVLALVLSDWRDVWPTLYGREPTDEDLVVPTRNMTSVNKSDAAHAMKADLTCLGLRVMAGKHRARGGHDLRSWFLTQTVEDGADSMLVRRCTHSPSRDVVSGYQRFSWSVLCREVSKLKVSLSTAAYVPRVHLQLVGPKERETSVHRQNEGPDATSQAALS